MGANYSLQTGQTTLTTSVSPTASVTATGSASAPQVYTAASAYVNYSASVSPVTISLTGTQLYNGVQDGLTGQQIIATLNGIPSGFTVTQYAWRQPSSNCFKTYDPTLASNQLVPLGSADLTGPATGNTTVAPFNFYDRAAEDLTVSITVTLLAPDGKTVLKLAATAPQITMEKPTATWGITSGYVRELHSVLGLFPAPGDTVNNDGQSWHDIAISVPTPFSGGTFAFAQLINPSVIIHRVLPQNSTATPNYQLPNNGVLGLDSVYPYDTDGVANGYSFPKPAGTEIDGDSPSCDFPTFTGVTDGGGTSWDKSTTSETFTTYLMYKPGSAGAVWVPLKSYIWSWSGVWAYTTDDLGNQQWTPQPGNPTAGSTPTAMYTNSPPTWAVVHAKSDYSNYVPGPKTP